MISFKNIAIENFKSIGKAEVNLERCGIVKVLGVNNYESNVNSNGSGKSSIFSALFWGLYGKTPEGILDVANRYTTGICQVQIALSTDDGNYEVIRSLNKSSHKCEVILNGNNVTCRNRTDTDKYIRDVVVKMSPDIFLTLVYLSQGFSSRLSLLTPSARKERLETLVNTVDKISEFSNRLQQLQLNNSNELRQHTSECDKLRGKSDSFSDMIKSCENELSEYKAQSNEFVFEGRTYTPEDRPKLQLAMTRSGEVITSLTDEASKHQSDLNVARNKSTQMQNDLQRCEATILDIDNKLSAISKGVCPTCGQNIHDNLSEDMRHTLSDDREINSRRITELTSNIQTSQSSINELTDKLNKVRSELDALKSKYAKQKHVLNNIPDVKPLDVNKITTQIEEYNQIISEISNNIDTEDKTINDISYKLDIISHCRQLVTKPFRNFLLEKSIDFMNNRLQTYSKFLFCNSSDVVSLKADSQRLDILLGDVLYDTLSGGEQRRVDIPLMLAQRDLASAIAGASCNILILDEILESMDETATQITLSLLEQQSKNVESMFLISHNNYSLPADYVLTVVKNDSRVASVTIA